MALEYKTFSAKVPLEGRTHIDKLDAGLTSVRGAQKIISMISSRRIVTKLVLGHNDLGNEGTNVLFRFLESPLGRKHPISEISLNSNGIRNEGLLAVSRYLKENSFLKELFLQANAFTGDPTMTRVFVEALNSSKLKILSLTTNHGLGDTFIEHFLPSLRAPHLRELHISTIGLTPRSVQYLSNFICSPQRCRLHTLACNGNSLGLRGVRSIIKGIEQKNYSLLSMEFYANQLSRDNSLEEHTTNDEAEEEEADESSFTMWKACQTHLARLHRRNDHLKRETQSQALELLRYSRALILHSSLGRDSTSLVMSPARSRHCTQSQDSQQGRNVFPFALLPTELQLSILSLLAPDLSSSQRTRIFGYAAAPNTLPPLLPSFRQLDVSRGCLPDLINPTLFPSGSTWSVSGSKDHCSSGRCMGVINTVFCDRDKERSRWLDVVECSVYEPE